MTVKEIEAIKPVGNFHMDQQLFETMTNIVLSDNYCEEVKVAAIKKYDEAMSYEPDYPENNSLIIAEFIKTYNENFEESDEDKEFQKAVDAGYEEGRYGNKENK